MFVKCHIDSLKEEVKGVQCYSFAGRFHNANPIRVACHRQKPQQHFRERWSGADLPEGCLMWVHAGTPQCRRF